MFFSWIGYLKSIRKRTIVMFVEFPMLFGNVLIMFFAGHRSHAIPLFVSANVLPLQYALFTTRAQILAHSLANFYRQ